MFTLVRGLSEDLVNALSACVPILSVDGHAVIETACLKDLPLDLQALLKDAQSVVIS